MTVNLEKYEQWLRAQFAPYDDEHTERMIQGDLSRMREAHHEKRLKHWYWFVRENSGFSRYAHEMNDPNANLRVVGVFRTKRSAFDAVERISGRNKKLEWAEVEANHYRVEWDEPCDHDTEMRCAATIRLDCMGYIIDGEWA